MKPLPQRIDGVLFDLDGTLLDSAPDLAAALDALCGERGVAPPPYPAVREVVSRGARAVLRRGFPAAEDEAIAALLPRYLDLYADVLGAATRPFDGVEALLSTLEGCGVQWGVVTNKPGFLTAPLLQRLGLAQRAAVVVSGDTLAVKKPDPAPVLHACTQIALDPRRCLFVGDDLRDVEAGRAAGAYTVAAAWGYLDGGDPHAWNADAVAHAPTDLIDWLDCA